MMISNREHTATNDIDRVHKTESTPSRENILGQTFPGRHISMFLRYTIPEANAGKRSRSNRLQNKMYFTGLLQSDKQSPILKEKPPVGKAR